MATLMMSAAEPCMGAVDEISDAEICERVDDLGSDQHSAHNKGAQTENIRAVECDITDEDHIDRIRHASGRPDQRIP